MPLLLNGCVELMNSFWFTDAFEIPDLIVEIGSAWSIAAYQLRNGLCLHERICPEQNCQKGRQRNSVACVASPPLGSEILSDAAINFLVV